jgi:phosphate starvation-inducible protein PhoH and related proteins
VEITVRLPGGPDRVSVLGTGDRNLKMLREALGVDVTAREGTVLVKGAADAVDTAQRVLTRLGAAVKEHRDLSRQHVLAMIADEASEDRAASGRPGSREKDGYLDVYSGGRPVRARTPNQERYLAAVQENDLVFAVGPAGTGKTYLAVASAIHLLKSGRAKRVILVRPAVEAGERLGFLPGDVEAKLNPYLRPLYDALEDMVDFGTLRRFIESDVVEVVPLAFMRGRTLNNAIIILDEAQNTTKGQMKMFLTRMGQGSKTIVTGDVTQIDLPDPRESGLTDAMVRLSRTAGVSFIGLERADVVRHPMVQRVIDAYGEDDADVLRPDSAARGEGVARDSSAHGAKADGSMASKETSR